MDQFVIHTKRPVSTSTEVSSSEPAATVQEADAVGPTRGAVSGTKVSQAQRLSPFSYQNPARGHQIVPHGGPGSFTIREHYQLISKKRREEASQRKATDILSGVVAHIDGYLGEGVNDLELKRLIEANGGRITRGPSAATTTHLVCTNLATSKRATLGSRKRTSFKIVDPKWITDSVAAGHRLPERPYEIL